MVSAIKNVLTVLAVAIERPITKLLSMKESQKPQQQENLENQLMQLKINWVRDDLDKMNVRPCS